MKGMLILGNEIATQAKVGEVVSFDLFPKGHRRIWLRQTQNGLPQHDGPYTLPMPTYELLPQDAGRFDGEAFALTPDNQPGESLATWSFTIRPARIQTPPLALATQI